MKRTLLSVSLAILTGFVYGQTQWNLDRSHTNIRFTTSHMVVSEVDGNFNEFEGTVTSPGDDFNGAEIEFTAEVGSIDTGNERRDNHLKSDDFFSAEKFPQIKFKGKLMMEGSDYYLVGDFTMRDVTKPVKFKTKFNGTIQSSRGRKAGFKIQGSVNRFDYGLKWDRTIEAGGLVVGEEVEITCNVELNEVTKG